MSAARGGRSRSLLAVPVLGLALAVSACGGASGGGGGATTSGTSSGSSGMSSSGSMPGMSSGQSMPSMTSYPPVTPGPSATGAHNAADVAFASGMIPHHGQAVVMSDLLLARSGNAEVKGLAQRIKQEQTPEITALAGWLKGWGSTVPNPYAVMDDQMAGMGQGGMMSNAQMRQLESAMGTGADKVFLTLMPEHHQGAIDMAKTELAKGVNPEARKLAESIIT
ncbi:MAG TPA: DUF305 domain-containing protein, partial [Kineosporiaceae bacterium]|nr:DUF305 domain-containing protein [Kineosporiaceae bacterium]